MPGWLRHRLALRLGLSALLALGSLGAASAQPAVDLTPRILELEQLGRARPIESAQQLERLSVSMPKHSSARLELLTVQGVMLALVSRTEAAEVPAAQLRAWGAEPNAPHAALAGAAAMLIRARDVRGSAHLQFAETLMRDAIARLPDTLAPRNRYRFVLAQARIADESGKLEDAVRFGHEALALADRTEAPWRQSEARALLAYAYYGAKQLERARELSLEAIDLSERASDWVSLARAHNTSGIVLDGLSDEPGERRSFELAIEYARRAGSQYDEARYLANLADYFLQNGDYKTALAQAEQALHLSRALQDPSSETTALANMGFALISLQRLDVGKRFVAQALSIDERRGSLTGVSNLTHELALYLEKAGDADGAIAAYHRHRKLATSLLRDDQQRAILTMQEEFDAERRNRELVLLNRENDLKAEQLHRRDLQQRLWWLLAAAFVLSFAVVALLYRRVRQTNRLLASSNELLRVQSERDPLTGLANRRHFQGAIRRFAADGKLDGTVYLIDIDHFKRINDSHGHGAGDAVLIEVARRLRETLREQDLIVRWGGEEFVIVVQALAPTQVEALAQRLLSALDHVPVTVGTQRIAVTVSIGFATFPIGQESLGVSWEQAIDLVDTAMYLAKTHGRNRACGVRLLQARDEAALDAITRSLEAAWRQGRVGLTLLQGNASSNVASAT